MGTRRQLVSALTIQFTDSGEHRIPTGKYQHSNVPRKVLVIGDAINAPPEIYVTPEVLPVGPLEDICICHLCLPALGPD